MFAATIGSKAGLARRSLHSNSRTKGTTMPTPPPLPADKPAAPVGGPPERAAGGRLGGAEAAVVITAITAVTVLTVLEHPVPALLTVLAAASVLLLLPGRALRLLDALTGSRL